MELDRPRQLGVSESNPLTEYIPFRARTPIRFHFAVINRCCHGLRFLFSRELGDVIDLVHIPRAILPAGVLLVAKASLWCGGLQEGQVRLEARISADQYKRTRGRPLTQV